MDDLQAHCGTNPNAIATTFTGAFVDDRTELYLSFFYSSSVIERAAVLVHESRHYDVGHNANFPPWSVLANANQGQQADSSWAYNGAYRYEVAYLSWYAAVSVTATPAMRERARQRANWCLNNAFATHPGFTIDAGSDPQTEWRWCNKCQGLAYAGGSQLGKCPAGGSHDHGGSGNYTLIHGTYAAGQNGWKWCNKCQGLAFSKMPVRERVPPAACTTTAEAEIIACCRAARTRCASETGIGAISAREWHSPVTAWANAPPAPDIIFHRVTIRYRLRVSQTRPVRAPE